MAEDTVKIVGRGVYYHGVRVAVLTEEGGSYSIHADFKDALLELEDPHVVELEREVEELKSDLNSASAICEERLDEIEMLKHEIKQAFGTVEQVTSLSEQVKKLVGQVQRFTRDH